MKWIVLLVMAFLLQACEAQTQGTAPTADTPLPSAFNAYWYNGEAELNRYVLSQVRYGEERSGEVILIYVTEPFLPEKQVKDEHGSTSSISVLKLNTIKRFETGIYDYSLMTSTFTPIDFRKNPYSLKVSFSAQDWCGHTFGQINFREGAMNYRIHSYFETPGDQVNVIQATYFEEDVWTRLRMDPQMLPLGEIEMVSPLEYMHLHHTSPKAVKAKAVLLLQVDDDQNEKYIYRIDYPEHGRRVEWHCERSFPFRILQWEETLSTNGTKSVSLARLSHTKRDKYWLHNRKKDAGLRDSLGVQFGLPALQPSY